MKIRNLMVASGLLLCLTQDLQADNTFILATGRRDPRIYAIDLERGTILARTPVPKGEVLGNLVLWGEDILTQTVWSAAACLLNVPVYQFVS